MATRIGLEPTTPSVTGWCSNQLSYRAMIAQVHRFWRLTAGTCVIIPEKRAVVKHEFRKMSKKFWKVRHSGKNTKTKRTEYSLCACGRGSKSRTHGTRFWRPLLYQLSYAPIYLAASFRPLDYSTTNYGKCQPIFPKIIIFYPRQGALCKKCRHREIGRAHV